MPEKNDPSVSPYSYFNSSGIGCLTTFVVGSLIFSFGFGIVRASGFPKGIADMFAFFMASVICTAGLGLLAWVPAWYVVGALTVFIFSCFRDLRETVQQKAGKRPHQQQHPLSAKLLAASRYIREAHDRGEKDPQIIEDLKMNGWQPSIIDQAFDYLRWKSGLEAGKGGAT